MPQSKYSEPVILQERPVLDGGGRTTRPHLAVLTSGFHSDIACTILEPYHQLELIATHRTNNLLVLHSSVSELINLALCQMYEITGAS